MNDSNNTKGGGQMQDLISTKEAAKIIGVSPATLEKWRNRKLFGVPFFAADENHGGTWYYERERVEQLKSVYQKGVLQNMYKLAKALDSIPSPDFQKSATSGKLPLASEEFYTPETVAKFLGVSEMTLSKWRDKEIFVEDYKTHVGISLYSQDRVLEMKMFCQKNTDSEEKPSKFSDVIMAEDPHATIHKITGSLRPSRIRVEINDKLAKVIFKLSDEGIEDLLNGDTFCIVEKRDKKLGEITTAYKILNSAGYQILRPFTMFDRFVLAVCISEWLKGNRYTTVAIIYRALTGKIGKSDAKPSVTQRKAIIESLEILMSRIVDYGAEEICQVMGYNNGNPFVGKAPLLPAAYIDFSAVNGDNDTLIFFTDEPPLLKMAQIKKQLVSYDATLLDMPGQNTPMNIASKNYTMLRIQEIILHKQLTPTITFGDVFKKLRIENAHVEIKRRVREYITAFFEHLQKASVVKSFEVVKHGNTFYGIKFPRPKKS